MIPLNLKMKNFMCYRNTANALDFRGLHVACLCGDNGHGKTAIIDAITWALWGQARAMVARNGTVSSPNMKDFVHLGESEMLVELDFLSSGQSYKVIRRHTIGAGGRNPRTTLEFQVASADNPDTFTSISGSRVVETNSKIVETLKMDFKTFINTAYLAQGQADVFTTSTPSERKKCLSDVLDLGLYERLSQLARSEGNSAASRSIGIRSEIDTKREEVAERPGLEEELREVESTLASLRDEFTSNGLHLENLQSQLASMNLAHRERDLVKQQVQAAITNRDRLKSQMETDSLDIRNIESLLERDPEARDGYEALCRQRSELTRLDSALSVLVELDKRRSILMQEVAVEREKLVSRRENLTERFNSLHSKASAAGALDARATRLESERRDLQNTLQESTRIRSHISSLDENAQFLIAQNEHLKGEMRDTRQKFDMLESGHDTCPLCEQRLTAEGQGRLRSSYRSAGLTSKSNYEHNSSEIQRLQAASKEESSRLLKLERDISVTERRLTTEAANLQRDREDMLEARDTAKNLSLEIEKLSITLNTEEYAIDSRVKLAELERKIRDLKYSGELHQEVRDKVRDLTSYENLHHRIAEAKKELPVLKRRADSNQALLAEAITTVEDGMLKINDLESQLGDYESIRSDAAALSERNRKVESSIRESEVRQGILSNNLQRCIRLSSEIEQAERTLRETAVSQGIYEDLTVAFGKNGIQALIIESAIPQIQNDANEILGRITDNRMHLRLELDESTSENLEIRIADEIGTRDYMTFSGGEAFRINFAIRIALSRLLARRSGAPLPVLFIDEGFGSQDKKGQERLTEAIQSIQDEFEKIIVITHIDEMKESFPTRIEVVKSERGSEFTIA